MSSGLGFGMLLAARNNRSVSAAVLPVNGSSTAPQDLDLLTTVP